MKNKKITEKDIDEYAQYISLRDKYNESWLYSYSRPFVPRKERLQTINTLKDIVYQARECMIEDVELISKLKDL